MKKSHTFSGYLLLGIGAYFLLKQLQIPILTDFYSWPTLLIIVGAVFLCYSYAAKEYEHLFTGTLLLGLGIHFHAVTHYAFWPHHWAMFPLIIGIAFLVRALKTRSGYLLGFILCIISLPMLLSLHMPEWFQRIYMTLDSLKVYWPIVLIVVGVYLLMRKK